MTQQSKAYYAVGAVGHTDGQRRGWRRARGYQKNDETVLMESAAEGPEVV